MAAGAAQPVAEPDCNGLVQDACSCSRPWPCNTGWLQVRRAAFIHHWQLLGCHGEPRQQQFYEVCDAGPALGGKHCTS